MEKRKGFVKGPHFSYDEDLDELCETEDESGGMYDTVVYGRVHKGQPPVFKPKRKTPKSKKKNEKSVKKQTKFTP